MFSERARPGLRLQRRVVDCWLQLCLSSSSVLAPAACQNVREIQTFCMFLRMSQLERSWLQTFPWRWTSQEQLCVSGQRSCSFLREAAGGGLSVSVSPAAGASPPPTSSVRTRQLHLSHSHIPTIPCAPVGGEVGVVAWMPG